SFEMHVRDTLEAGAGLCREDVVRTIIEEGPARIAELIELGMRFSEREIPRSNGVRELDLGKEGGHSKRRILHAKDVTGREIERALLNAISQQPNIQIFENHLAIDLVTTAKLEPGRTGVAPVSDFSEEMRQARRLSYGGPNRCLGAYVFDKKTGAVGTFA